MLSKVLEIVCCIFANRPIMHLIHKSVRCFSSTLTPVNRTHHRRMGNDIFDKIINSMRDRSCNLDVHKSVETVSHFEGRMARHHINVDYGKTSY